MQINVAQTKEHPRKNLKRKIQHFEKHVVLRKWTEVNRYCLKGETINHFVQKLGIRNLKVAHVAPFLFRLNQWKTSIKSSYQWRLLFLWIYFCTTNTPAFLQSGPFCVFEVKILLVCPEVLKKMANGKNHSLLRYTFEWQTSKTRELLNIIFNTFSWWEKKRDWLLHLAKVGVFKTEVDFVLPVGFSCWYFVISSISSDFGRISYNAFSLKMS